MKAVTELNESNLEENGIMSMENMQPRFNEQLQVYILNFDGKHFKPSIKNFKLRSTSNEQGKGFQLFRLKDILDVWESGR